MKVLRAQPCSPLPGRLCEGPVWDGSRLLWVDIRAGLLHQGMLDGADIQLVETLRLDGPVSAVLPCVSGSLLVMVGDRICRIVDGLVKDIVPLPFPNDSVIRRMNDAKVDPCGRVFAGSMSEDGVMGSAALYRLDPDGTLSVSRTGVTISNGLGWSPDGGTLYYTDSPTQRVEAFDYDLDSGTFGNGRVFAEFADGDPDGLTVDADGRVWVAVWGAGQVRAFDPDGRPYAVVDVGPSQVSSCTFAGPDLDRLVITTAAEQNEPEAGRLFTCRPGSTGLPITPYADTGLVPADDR
ncbi:MULTISPECIES: SMP-30/gluconolactonase/LRE family protein [unclassified Nocardia]|uniref:SMP-30/gluconolactonase/LRE family protein n=1 Tax=unclassified Nocardia TaxID=2637762 RepID=UPI001CE3B6AA|nr:MULTISPECIES: SMP-30/gluconolactonase/LRE family protein [unclassified Nocardia]